MAFCSKILTITLGLIGAVVAMQRSSEKPIRNVDTNWASGQPRIKAYFVNMASSADRRHCMHSQLTRLSHQAKRAGAVLDFDRYPAVAFSQCTDAQTCIEERPECFPIGKTAYIDHGKANLARKPKWIKDKEGISPDNSAQAIRGVLGNWCAHLNLMKYLLTEDNLSYDYFLLLEDDTIFSRTFVNKLLNMLRVYPLHWSLVAIDTFPGQGSSLPEEDRFGDDFGLKMYSMSGSKNTYWGAHAWMVSRSHLVGFLNLIENTPAFPIDFISKVPHPLHMGLWAFQPGAARQHDFLNDNELSHIDRECKKVGGSDIEGKLDEELSHSDGNISEGGDEVGLINAREGSASPREVIVLGMPGVDARAISKLIKEGLEDPLQVKLCLQGSKSGDCGRIWAHTHPARLDEAVSLRSCGGVPEKSCNSLGELKDAVVVAVVRHPFAVIGGLKSNMMETGLDCGAGDGAEGLTETCIVKQNSTKNKVPSASCLYRGAQTCFNSPAAAWNSYARGYKSIRNSVNSMMVLRYEDVIDAPFNALERIAAVAGVQAPERSGKLIQKWTRWSRKHPETVPRCQEMRTMCSQIEKPLLFELGYHGCQMMWPTYNDMIYNGDTFQRSDDEIPEVIDHCKQAGR